MTVKSVGFIGLGDIGRPMAVHIASAFDAVVWNRTGSVAQDFAGKNGVRVAGSPADLVASVDVVVTCLPTSVEVLEITRAAGDAWRSGQLLIDTTSGDPVGSQAVASYLGKRGVGFVDAPVSGGTNGAEAGTLTVMLGGDERWIPTTREVVSCFSKVVEHVGPVGAAHALKAVNQALLAINLLVAGEGLAALVKQGVSPDVALKVINASSGRSNVTENLIPQRVVTGSWPRTFRLALLDKDVGVALEVLAENGVADTAVGIAKDALAKARIALGEEADHVELIKEIERAAGVEIRRS